MHGAGDELTGVVAAELAKSSAIAVALATANEAAAKLLSAVRPEPD
ncbi:hypothetical protein FJQ55_22510 [Rhizobium glycinendophyticum]|uniref:Uncharacterized protein n=1 Tax=Rhizobium glycinendophyticum TaxID=2589807 RepID=A0A504UFL7_9HYPH|nr:hypothetical protein FJQ55_22510 [Rhizobium glycinendophyticum]